MLYFWSFDPFHNGHLEVTEIMLKFCDIILITTINKKKPLLSSYEDSINIICNALKNNQKPIY